MGSQARPPRPDAAGSGRASRWPASSGLGLLASRAGAGAAPELPPVTPEDLVSSVLAAQPGPFRGTVELDNALGLPALPGAPKAGDGTTHRAGVVQRRAGGGRIQLPTDGGERTLVSDGTTLWAWDSADRTVVTGPRSGRPADRPDAATTPRPRPPRCSPGCADQHCHRGRHRRGGRPAGLRAGADARCRPSARCCGRCGSPSTRQKRIPLRLAVLATGSPDPALQRRVHRAHVRRAGPGAVHVHPAARRDRRGSGAGRAAGASRTDRTDGRRRLGHRSSITHPRRSAASRPERAPDLATLGTPVSGPWGSGRLITHRGRAAYRHRRRPGRRRRGARAGARRGARLVTSARGTTALGAARASDRPTVPAARARRAAQGVRHARSPSTGSTSTCRPARCSACSAPTARARPP